MPRITPQRRAERREQILRAAIRCVVRSGFQGMTMGEVIGESGLSAGAVYRYFDSKNDLLAAVADVQLGGIERLIAAAGDREPPAPPVELVERLAEWVLSMARGPDGDLTVVVVQIWGQAVLEGEVRDILVPRLHDLHARLTDLARSWQRHAMIGADARPDVVARVVMGLMPGFMLQRLVLGEIAPGAYADGLRSLLAAAGAVTAAADQPEVTALRS